MTDFSANNNRAPEVEETAAPDRLGAGGRVAYQGSRRAEGPGVADPRGDGEPAPPHRARGCRFPGLCDPSFARDLVGVADNIRRALDAAQDSGVILEGPAKALVDGVELTERELLKVLEKNGVRKFDPQGQKFDPNLHQAMFEVPDARVPSGSVVQVIQPGYAIGDRVCGRHSSGVSKGGPRVAPTPSGAPAGEA